MFSSQIYGSWEKIQEEKYKAIIKSFPEIFSGIILDIGSKGYFEKFLSGKIDANIICIDIEKPTSILADGNDLPFKDASFDMIISIDAIHIVKSNDFSRVLKKNGLALFTTFFNSENYYEKKKFLEEKLEGFEIIRDLEIHGKESEYVLLAKK